MLWALPIAAVAAGVLTGYEDQRTNRWAWEIDANGRDGNPAARALNNEWHRWALRARFVAFAVAIPIAAALPPAAWWWYSLLGGTAFATFSLALNVGHNRASGHPPWYVGTVAPFDRFIRWLSDRTRIGTRLWFAAFVLALVGLWVAVSLTA